LTPAGKTFLDELPMHGGLLIFAERSVEVQSETIHRLTVEGEHPPRCFSISLRSTAIASWLKVPAV
jgi:hypothetical protein